MKEEVINSMDNPNNLLEPFKVYVRIRPFLSKEILKLKRNNSSSLLINNTNNRTNYESIFKVNKNNLYVYDIKHHKKEKKYIFNNIFTEKNNNNDVFDISIKSMINNVLEGYNSTCLAYGVTGTGKTHTIFGDLVVQNGEDGIAIKACDYLFKKLSNKYFEDECLIKVSYIEIYNENVIDLLNNESSSSSSLMIIEDPNKGVYCPNIKEYVISNSLELKKIICKGNKRRTMAPTNQNKFSSRSHAILQISLERKSFNEEKNNFDIYFSKFLMVDLAGSERGGLEKGKRREEGANINKSLFTLGSCINILSDKNKLGKFIPYRDSKLTRLLKDSLGGNILTVMLVCVSPSSESYEESISSLNYATRAKKIKKKIFQNKKEVNFIEGNNNINFRNNNNQYEEIIGSLKNEIYQLKSIIKEQENKLRNKSKSNETLNLEDDSLINDKQKSPNFIRQFFNDESSIVSSIQINNSQINIKTKNNNNNQNINIRNHTNNQNLNTSAMNSFLTQAINDIDIEKYNIYFNEIKNKDIEINSLQEQIENIKKDKNNLELYLEQNHMACNDNIENIINSNDNDNDNQNPEKKYIIIKNYYDKFLEVINDKLIENIEQNMILKCNIKEITELNKNNIDNLENLNKQVKNYKKNENCEEHDCEYDNLNEQIKNIKNTIKENLMLKNDILKTYNENMNKKKLLKQILVSLLGDKRENSNKLINILKDKEKLVQMNKEFQKKIENYLKIQKKKDNDINIVQRQVEILRAQLKEKDKKIIELRKYNNSNSNNNKRNNSNSINKSKNTNNYNNINLYYIKKNRNDFNNLMVKGKRSTSCIRNCNNINNLYNNKLKKNETKKEDKKQKTYIYCYDASNDSNSNYISKMLLNKDLNKITDNTNNKKRNNNHKYKSKSEDKLENNTSSINNDNNDLFKKMIFKNNKDEKFRINTINVNDVNDEENWSKTLGYQNENTMKNNRNPNESDKKKNINNFNELLMKYNHEKNNYAKKINTKCEYDNTRNNKKTNNLSQKRYEKFMNNHIYNNSHNNNQEDMLPLNISKKINKINKKLSLNEARYEKKIKNEKSEKQRDLSVELNHANAELFINSFKGMKLKQNNNEYFENTNSNFFKKNKIYTQNSQNMGSIMNTMIEKNKNQNSTINIDGNQIETKENESTNIKTDQTKILKTEDMYQDLVNSLRTIPFKFKHK